MIDAAGDGDVININAEVINGGRQFFILSMCCGGGSYLSEDKLFNMGDRLFNINEHFHYVGNGDGDRKDLRVELAKTIISLHGGALGVDSSDEEKGSYIIFFPAGRFVFKD